MATDTNRTLQRSPARRQNRPPLPIQQWAIFADESGIVSDRFTVVGGSIVERKWLSTIYDAIHSVRERHDIWGELKWTKVSERMFPAYRDLVDVYFEFVDAGRLQFRATTFDNGKWDHVNYNNGDPDIGLSKLYFHMLLHQFVGDHGDVAGLFICMDRRNSSTPFEDLRRMLNNAAARDYKLTFGPVRVLTARDSKKDDMLQMNDVILGAIAARKNDRLDRPGARAAKKELADYVFTRSGLASLAVDTPKNETAFRLWNLLPRK